MVIAPASTSAWVTVYVAVQVACCPGASGSAGQDGTGAGPVPENAVSSTSIADMGPFELVSDGTAIPVFAFEVKPDTKFTVFHVSDRLRSKGWQVPAYTMPDNAADVAVLRVVVREGFSLDLAGALVEDIRATVAFLDANPPTLVSTDPGFAH